MTRHILFLVTLYLFAGEAAYLLAETAPVAPAVPQGTVLVATASAPPQWAQTLIADVEKLPVVGPIVSKALLVAGIVAGIMTTLVATLLGILNTLAAALNLAGIADFARKVAAFKDGKIMYWLKFFSLFNAKPNPPTT